MISYTLTGQQDLAKRLRAACQPNALPEVSGWYAFLMHHYIRPFLALKYPKKRLAGLNFEGSPPTNSKGVVIATGAARYLDKDSRAYKRFLSKLAIDVARKSGGSVIDRLQRIYNEIYVDEVQDMTGYDLDVLEQLLDSSIRVRLVGDIRQSVFDTNPQDPRLKQYRGLKMLDWFNLQAQNGLLTIEYSSRTWRSVERIARFSDTIFDPAFNFPPTISCQEDFSEHDGVFTVSPNYLSDYLAKYRPICLRQALSTRIPTGMTARNFGTSKGLTFDRVLIFPTEPIRKFLCGEARLPNKSACGLYVGVTRAVHSVAFPMDAPHKSYLPTWTP